MAALITFQRDSAYEKLLSLIVDGQLLPDQPISERQIAAELKIGRTPVREAMRALAQDGLLEIVPARGTFVRSISDNQLRELYEVRQALEGQAAELAARNGATQKLLEFVGKLNVPEKPERMKNLAKHTKPARNSMLKFSGAREIRSLPHSTSRSAIASA